MHSEKICLVNVYSRCMRQGEVELKWEKMSLGGKKIVVGGIMQHQVNSEQWEELMWQKQHKAYTLRPQPLKFIAVEDIGIQNQREKKKNDGIKYPNQPIISFRNLNEYQTGKQNQGCINS